MTASWRRIFLGVLVAVPLVAAVAGTLVLAAPRAVSLGTALLGLVLLKVAETFHLTPTRRVKLAAAAGGALTMGGVLAWAITGTG